MLTGLFGDSPQVKILDYIIDNKELDFTISDVIEGSDVSRVTVYKIWGGILKLGIVKKTRKIGNAQLYQLDIENPLVKKLLSFDIQLSKLLVSSILEEI